VNGGEAAATGINEYHKRESQECREREREREREKGTDKNML
jgi:hypothetical protein